MILRNAHGTAFLYSACPPQNGRSIKTDAASIRVGKLHRQEITRETDGSSGDFFFPLSRQTGKLFFYLLCVRQKHRVVYGVAFVQLFEQIGKSFL